MEGDSIGENNLIEGGKWNSTAICKEDCYFIAIELTIFE